MKNTICNLKTKIGEQVMFLLMNVFDATNKPNMKKKLVLFCTLLLTSLSKTVA